MTHLRWLKALAGFGGLGLRLRADDTLYSCLPLYHNNALTVAVSSVLSAGATLALGRSSPRRSSGTTIVTRQRLSSTSASCAATCSTSRPNPPTGRTRCG
jgi:fatty-acyl-CoA synthase